MAEVSDWVARAQRIADGTLFPAAMAVEQGQQELLPHLNQLADEGFYGLPAPVDHGGMGRDSLLDLCDSIAAFAGGCLTTTFVWLQHLAPLMAVAARADPAFRQHWLGSMAAGKTRAGLAMAHPELITVRPVPGGYLLNGESRWVTGWGLVDVLLVGGVNDQGLLHFFLADAGPSVNRETLLVKPAELIAVQESRTVSLRFVDHFVPDERLGRTEPLATFAASDDWGPRMNGFLSIGVARRCARMLDAPDLDADIDVARRGLLTAGGDEIPQARAHATLLAARAAARLMVATGSRSVLAEDDAGRIYRECGFLLVFGLRPGIKDGLLRRLSAPVGVPV